MNDPNGLIYDRNSRTYHLYYQFQEEIIPVNCIVQWGHATSTNLIDWKECKPVLSPDKYGIIMSGSAVVDEDNTSGLFDDSAPRDSRFVAFYASGILGGRQAIAVAYSTDGFNYEKYNGGEPILYNNDLKYNDDFRDAKVIRYKSGWLMVVGGGQLKIFYSENLLDWQYQSSVKNVESEDKSIDKDLEVLHKYLPYSNPYNEIMPCECPDIFPFDVDGETKWVILGGGVFYIVGDLVEQDGKITFIPLTKKKRFYSCNDFFAHSGEGYASQSFYNDKSARRIVMTWLMDDTSKSEKDKFFNGVQSLPTKLSLEKEIGDYVLKVKWVEELYDKFVLDNSSKFDGVIFAEFKWDKSSNAEIKLSSSNEEISICSQNGRVVLSVDGKERISFEEKNENQMSFMIDGMVLSLILNQEIQYSTFVFGKDKRYRVIENGKFNKVAFFKEKT
ncbi:MAG: glycoside hydrolase family 32 protein [Clostridia bacterium]|nr:glycoside hydrolase family 32 protein [Clostridia bacterium]